METAVLDTNRRTHFRIAIAVWLVLTVAGAAAIIAAQPISTATMLISLVAYALILALYIGQTVPGASEQFAAKTQTPLRTAAAAFAGIFLFYLLYAISTGSPIAATVLPTVVLLALPLALSLPAGKKALKLTFWDSLLILSIWFPIEFGWHPSLSIPPAHGLVGLYKMFGLILAIFIFQTLRRIPDMGLQLRVSLSDTRTALLMTAVFMLVFALPIGTATGFLGFGMKEGTAFEYLAGILGTAFFIALPEEILFRGIIQRLIEKSMPARKHLPLLIASVIFGLAHANNHNPPFVGLHLGTLGTLALPWVYIVLAAIAGWFYGKTYQKTGNLAAAAMVHWLVDCIWWMFFGNV